MNKISKIHDTKISTNYEAPHSVMGLLLFHLSQEQTVLINPWKPKE
jgi:hypothetical protein